MDVLKKLPFIVGVFVTGAVVITLLILILRPAISTVSSDTNSVRTTGVDKMQQSVDEYVK